MTNTLKAAFEHAVLAQAAYFNLNNMMGFVAQINFELGFSLTPYLSKDTLSRWRTQMSETV